ncbi:MAG: ribonuclease Z [Eubacterium sp.]|nr:ribonuclease Z [Eubacterium sp.]
MLDVCLLGCGGMMPLPKRALTALMLRYNGSSMLIDCGEGTQVSVRSQGWSFNPIDLICITHFHGDHISGLPGLLLSMGNADRTEPVTIIGPKGLRKVVNSILIIAQRLPFELHLIEFEGDSFQMDFKGYDIKAYKVNHNVLCYAYTVEIHRSGKFDPAKAEANQVPMKAWSRLQKMENVTIDGREYTPDMVLGPTRKGIKLSYCTDTRPTEDIVSYSEGSDLFICEGMYGEKEKIASAKEKKHMTMYEAAELAARANVSELWLTHYSPSLFRPEQYKEEVRNIFPGTRFGKDRMFRELKFED